MRKKSTISLIYRYIHNIEFSINSSGNLILNNRRRMKTPILLNLDDTLINWTQCTWPNTLHDCNIMLKKWSNFYWLVLPFNNNSQRMTDENRLDEYEIWMRIVDFGLVIVTVVVRGHKITKATQTFLQRHELSSSYDT